MKIRQKLALLASAAAMAGMVMAGSASAKELKYVTFKPQAANDAHSQTLQWFVDEFAKRTGGKHTMKVFWGGSVAQVKEVPDAIETGIGDLGDIVVPYFQDKFLLNGVVTFFSPQPHSEIELGQKLIEWYEKYPQFDAEMQKYNSKIIAWRPLEDYGIMCVKPVNSPEDLKGLRIRSYGHALPRLIEQLGATPVSMTTSDAYEALERNILDCTPTGVTLARGWRFEEVAKYYIKVQLGANWGHFIAMNRDSFDSLDDQTKAILVGLGKEYVVHYVNVLSNLTDEIKAEWKTKGVKIMPFPAAAVAKAVQSDDVQKIRQDWIDRASKSGLPAAELAEYFNFD